MSNWGIWDKPRRIEPKPAFTEWQKFYPPAIVLCSHRDEYRGIADNLLLPHAADIHCAQEYDKMLPRDPLLTLHGHPVATTLEKFRLNIWNMPKFSISLQCQNRESGFGRNPLRTNDIWATRNRKFNNLNLLDYETEWREQPDEVSGVDNGRVRAGKRLRSKYQRYNVIYHCDFDVSVNSRGLGKPVDSLLFQARAQHHKVDCWGQAPSCKKNRGEPHSDAPLFIKEGTHQGPFLMLWNTISSAHFTVGDMLWKYKYQSKTVVYTNPMIGLLFLWIIWDSLSQYFNSLINRCKGKAFSWTNQ